MDGTSRLDVTGSLGLAWNRMVLVLFKPFDIVKWLALGLVILLESLGQVGGSSGNFNFPGGSGSGSGSSGGPSSPADFADLIDEGFRWIGDNLTLVLGIGIPAVGLFLCLYVVFLWLSSRGMLMFVRAVAKNDARIGDNWRATRYLVGSLLKVRLVVASVSWVIVLGGLGALFYVLYRLLRRNETDWAAYALELAPLFLVWMLVAFVPGLVSALLRNFVAPMMLQFQESCLDAFRRFMSVLKANIGAVILFLILRFLFHVLFEIVNIFVVLLTCCIGGLPVINQAITAPFHVFDRAWSMYALRALGPAYDLFAEPVPPPAAPQTWGSPAP